MRVGLSQLDQAFCACSFFNLMITYKRIGFQVLEKDTPVLQDIYIYLSKVQRKDLQLSLFVLKVVRGNSLVVQQLTLVIFTGMAQVQFLVRELRSCKLPVMTKREKKRDLEVFQDLVRCWLEQTINTFGNLDFSRQQ